MSFNAGSLSPESRGASDCGLVTYAIDLFFFRPYALDVTYLDAVLYGVVQGITEYLPISSSAHLILLPHWLGVEDPGLTFDVFLHLGTLLATLVYFWKDWKAIFRKLLFGKGTPDLDWRCLVYATIPAVIAGGLLHSLVRSAFRGPGVLVVTLSLGGVALFLADRFSSSKRPLKSLRPCDAWWVGLAQCFALVPGVSRAGATIIGGRLLGFDRATAARFSFLMSAPIIAAATLFELRNWNELFGGGMGDTGPILIAGLSAFVAGMAAIGGLMRLLKRFGYLSFAIYRLVLAVVVGLSLSG